MINCVITIYIYTWRLTSIFQQEIHVHLLRILSKQEDSPITSTGKKNDISLHSIGTAHLYEIPYSSYIFLCLNFHEIPTFWMHFLVQDRKAQG